MCSDDFLIFATRNAYSADCGIMRWRGWAPGNVPISSTAHTRFRHGSDYEPRALVRCILGLRASCRGRGTSSAGTTCSDRRTAGCAAGGRDAPSQPAGVPRCHGPLVRRFAPGHRFRSEEHARYAWSGRQRCPRRRQQRRRDSGYPHCHRPPALPGLVEWCAGLSAGCRGTLPRQRFSDRQACRYRDRAAVFGASLVDRRQEAGERLPYRYLRHTRCLPVK